MLILSEENKKLKGTKYKLPDDIYSIFKNIVKKSDPSNDTAYVKAKNVVKDGGIVNFDWLKNMKAYFKKHNNESDPEFLKIGGYAVKYYVESTLDRLTSTIGKSLKKTNPMKPRSETSNYAGYRGDKSSSSLNIAKSLMAGIIPRFESTEKQKNIIINEEQMLEIKKIINKTK